MFLFQVNNTRNSEVFFIWTIEPVVKTHTEMCYSIHELEEIEKYCAGGKYCISNEG